MQYSSKIKQKTLEELTPVRRKQIDIADILSDMIANNKGWGIYEKWLSDQYDDAVTQLKTCKPEELIDYQVAIRYIESLKRWLTTTIEKGAQVKAILVSKTKEGK